MDEFDAGRKAASVNSMVNKMLVVALVLVLASALGSVQAKDDGNQGQNGDKSKWVAKTGDTMTGPLDMGSNAVRFGGVDLQSPSRGVLQFGGRSLCYADDACSEIPDGSITGEKFSSSGCPDGSSWRFLKEVDPAPARWACMETPDTGIDGIDVEGRNVGLSSEGCPDGSSWRFFKEVDPAPAKWACLETPDTGLDGISVEGRNIRLWPPGPSRLGGVRAMNCAYGMVLTGIDTTGSPMCGRPTSALGGLELAHSQIVAPGIMAPTRYGVAMAGVIPGDGVPLFVFEDVAGSLVAAKCVGDVSPPDPDRPAMSTDGCPGVTLATIQSDCGGCVARLALGLDGNPIMSILRPASGGSAIIGFARCSDASCSTDPAFVELDSNGLGGFRGAPGLAIGADGRPVLAYWAIDTARAEPALRIARCGNDACSAGNTFSDLDAVMFNQQPDPPGQPGVAMGFDGHPVLAFPAKAMVDESLHRVVALAVCVDADCSGLNSFTVLSSTSVDDPNIHGPANVILSREGRPLVAFSTASSLGGPATVFLAACGDAMCQEGTAVSTMDAVAFNPQPDPPGEPWLALGADGFAIVANLGFNNPPDGDAPGVRALSGAEVEPANRGGVAVHLATCLNAPCTRHSQDVIDVPGGTDGLPGAPWVGVPPGGVPLLAFSMGGDLGTAEATSSDSAPIAHPEFQYYSATAADFQAEDDDRCKILNTNGEGFWLFPCWSLTSRFFAPVHLPGGAVVSKMTLFAFDDDAHVNLEVELLEVRNVWGGNAVTSLGTAQTTGATGGESASKTFSPGDVVIDNENHFYIVAVKMVEAPEGFAGYSNAPRLGSVRLTYWE